MTSPPVTGETEQFWWPSIDDLGTLVVEDIDGGYQLSAPDGTPCSDWIEYWSETPEREALFSQEFQKVLLDHLNRTLEQHGESTLLEQQNDSSDSQEIGAGSEQAD
jgi:hypothetical protein